VRDRDSLWRGTAAEEDAGIRRWVKTWKEAGPELEAIRRRELAEADNLKVLALLEDAFNHAITLPPRPSSGLVEMQKFLARLPQ
jgi:hypothetical protein